MKNDYRRSELAQVIANMERERLRIHHDEPWREATDDWRGPVARRPAARSEGLDWTAAYAVLVIVGMVIAWLLFAVAPVWQVPK